MVSTCTSTMLGHAFCASAARMPRLGVASRRCAAKWCMLGHSLEFRRVHSPQGETQSARMRMRHTTTGWSESGYGQWFDGNPHLLLNIARKIQPMKGEDHRRGRSLPVLLPLHVMCGNTCRAGTKTTRSSKPSPFPNIKPMEEPSE